MKVFISGPKSCRRGNNKPAFDRCEQLLREQGFSPFNPLWLQTDSEWSEDDHWSIDMAALACCDAVVFLDRWQYSPQSRTTYDVASRCGIELGFMSEDGKTIFWPGGDAQ